MNRNHDPVNSAGKRPPPRSGLQRQHGAFAIMFVPLLMLMVAFCGLALDIGRLYNRNVDMKGMANTVALAAARELNGTPAGIVSAKLKAKEAAERLRYHYFGAGRAVTWNEDALSFGTAPSRSGTWTAASALGSGSANEAQGMYFAKVDSERLDRAMTTIDTYFIRIFSDNLANLHVRDSAVAGKASINVAPIGICAMSTERATERTATAANGTTLSELVQYGFRRGVSYDIMQLNPGGLDPARFALNPSVAPGRNGSTFDAAALRLFMCNGTMWVPRLSGEAIRVTRLPDTAPLDSLHATLNARFNVFAGGACEASVSPPDGNIKQYAYDQANGVKWMDPSLGQRAAQTTRARNKLETVADLPDGHPDAPTSKGAYGPLWMYARAVKAPSPVTAEPSSGFAPFDASAATWSTLYKSGPSVSSAYPAAPATPYQSTSTSSGFFVAPAVASGTVATRHRRVLNLPLLSCSPAIPSGSNAPANVIAIARFFMTVPATSESLIAEFSGLTAESSLSGEVRLYP